MNVVHISGDDHAQDDSDTGPRRSVPRRRRVCGSRSALLVLDQHIRDSAAAIERARRALAVAIAQDEAEERRLETTLSRLADLEERAVAALGCSRWSTSGSRPSRDGRRAADPVM